MTSPSPNVYPSFPDFSFPQTHVTTSGSFPTDANGFCTNQGYILYGRNLPAEMSGGIAAYDWCMDAWGTSNYNAKTILAGHVNYFKTDFRNGLLSEMLPSSIGSPLSSIADRVPTIDDQRSKLAEMAAAAKSLYDDNEIDLTQNAQYAAGMSAAMGGGHNTVTAIKDNITFEQKLQAKQLALSTYSQAVEAYFKIYTATAAQIGMSANQGALTASASIPTVVPFESQLAADIYANWQDTLNTGQMRDQQIRQTLNGARAMKEYFTASQSWVSNPAIVGQYSGEVTATVFGVRSQYKAADTF